MLEEDAPYYCYRRNETHGTHTSLFGDKLSKQEFENRRSFNNYVERRSNLFESDISPVYKFLSDNFYETEDTSLNTAFFDIEVDYDLSEGNGYPIPENPFGEINSFSLYNTKTDEYHLITLHEDIQIDTPEDETVHIYHCVTERQLLDTFFKVIEDVDVLSAWYGDKYDIPYIIERCIEVYGEKGMKKLCRDGHKIKAYTKKDDYGNEYVHYTLVGRVHLDYMELYKKFTFGERDSYALDSIAEYELKENKLKYKGDLGDLYRSDPKTFFEYSLHDSRLLKLLDDKLKFIKLATQMAKQATIKLTDVFGSIRYLEHSVMNYCHFDRKEKLILPDKNPNNKKKKFPGAWVCDPDVGVHKYVSTIDLTSLYPNVLMSLGMSPETFIIQCDNHENDFLSIVSGVNKNIDITIIETGNKETINVLEFKKILVDNGFSISANGSVFDGSGGLIPEVLSLWFSERKKLKKISKDFYKNNDVINGDLYDMYQHILKISLNSLYGAISNPYCRFYNIDIARSVTLTGQYINKFQAYSSDKILHKML